jgi:flavodoxin
MRAAVVYESMFGNTAAIAEAIGRGLRSVGVEVTVAPFDAFAPATVIDLDLLVVGAPTHARGLSHETTGETALQDEQDVYDGTTPEPGIRDWLEDLPEGAGRAAVAFDTRRHGPKILTGAAGKTIENKLELGGFQMAAEHESFLVTKDNALDDGEEARAEAWAADLGGVLETILQQR